MSCHTNLHFRFANTIFMQKRHLKDLDISYIKSDSSYHKMARKAGKTKKIIASSAIMQRPDFPVELLPGMPIPDAMAPPGLRFVLVEEVVVKLFATAGSETVAPPTITAVEVAPTETTMPFVRVDTTPSAKVWLLMTIAVDCASIVFPPTTSRVTGSGFPLGAPGEGAEGLEVVKGGDGAVLPSTSLCGTVLPPLPPFPPFILPPGPLGSLPSSKGTVNVTGCPTWVKTDTVVCEIGT
jgi:hypothetical protein